MKTAKNGLTNGCLVQFRNKSVMMYVSTRKEAGFIDPRDRGHMDLDSYDDDLKIKEKDCLFDSISDWDIIAYTKPLDLVGMKMDWEDKFTVNKKYLAWTEPSGIDFDRPAILRQEWTPSCGTPNYRIVETNGCHAGVMFEGFILFDSSDLDLDPMQFSDNFAKPDKGDPDNYKLKLVKYI